MKDVLVLGAGGTIGNAIHRIFTEAKKDFVATVSHEDQKQFFPQRETVVFHVDNDAADTIEKILKQYRPKYIINAIGVIRPKETVESLKETYLINSVFPQRLQMIADRYEARVIHLSTDCVFSGKTGNYKETDIPDEASEYGKSKAVGEIRTLPHLTIRTSVIGREFTTQRNLLDWFLKSKETVLKGFDRAIWNGISTITLARILLRIVEKKLSFDLPLIHIGSETVNKYQLLTFFKEIYDKPVIIEVDSSFVINRNVVPFSGQEKYFSDLVKPIRQQIEEIKQYYPHIDHI